MKKAFFDKQGIRTEPKFERKETAFESGTSAKIAVEEYSLSHIDKKMPGVFSLIGEQKGGHFQLNPLLRNAKSVEVEVEAFIKERVESRIQEIRASVEKDAEAKGFAAGAKQAHETVTGEVRSAYQEKTKYLDKLILDLENARNEIFKFNEALMVQLIFRLSKALILRELRTDKEYLVKQVHEILAKLGTRENVKVTLHQEDLASLSDIQKSIVDKFPDLKNLTIQGATSGIERGSCRVETQWNSIESTIEGQLGSLYQALATS